jgi:chorismate mutase
MRFRGVRGAITVDANTEAAILDATHELLQQMVKANEVDADEIAGILFTVTPDLNATFPAEAGRRLPGWTQVPLMCAQEVPVPGALPRCVRVLMLVNTTKTAGEVQHVYLRGAERLRPDLTPSSAQHRSPLAERGR